MHSQFNRWAFFFILVLALSGCARVPLQYEHPTAMQPPITELKLVYTFPQDQRSSREEMDKILGKSPVEEINKIIEEEVKSSGLFKEVVPVAKGIPDEKALEACGENDLFMSSCLKKMAWEVPDYGQKQAKAFAASFAFGLIGGMAYGMTKTDVYGDAAIRITLVKKSTGEKLIDKDYVAHVEENMAKLQSDTYETRSRMAGKAIKSIMEQFKEDLAKVVQST